MHLLTARSFVGACAPALHRMFVPYKSRATEPGALVASVSGRVASCADYLPTCIYTLYGRVSGALTRSDVSGLHLLRLCFAW